VLLAEEDTHIKGEEGEPNLRKSGVVREIDGYAVAVEEGTFAWSEKKSGMLYKTKNKKQI
jgi:hypothetical protein